MGKNQIALLLLTDVNIFYHITVMDTIGLTKAIAPMYTT